MSLTPAFVKEEAVIATECAVEVSTGGEGLSVGIKVENERALTQPSDPYLCPYMEVTVKIEHGEAYDDHTLNPMHCHTEMKTPNFVEGYDCTKVVVHEKMNTSFSPKEINRFRKCFVKLEHICLNNKSIKNKTLKNKLDPATNLTKHMLCYTENISNLQMERSNSLQTGANSCTCSYKKYGEARCHVINRRENRSKKDKGFKAFECNDCRKRFKSKYSLTNHKQIHTGDRPYLCPTCNKSFSKLVNLTRHERIHTGDKPYCCNICNKLFSIKANLVTHIRIHTQEKPYKCDFCEKQFVHSSDLKKHERVHTGEKPFGCAICVKRFARKYCLVKHLRTHTKKVDKQRKKRH